jgi:hypothetical protein
MTNTPIAPSAAPLDPAISRLLLLGPLSITTRDRDRVASVYRAGPKCWAELWRAHEEQLKQFALQHHLTPIGGRCFFAEAIAARERRRS